MGKFVEGRCIVFCEDAEWTSLQGSMDFTPVVWQKSGPKGKASKSASEVNAARRSGGQVETDRKINAGGNKSAHSTIPNAAKLDENTEAFRHDTVSHDFKMAL